MKRILVICLTTCMFALQSQAQNPSFYARAFTSAGFSSNTINYVGLEMSYSSGSGIGMEAGLQFELNDNLHFSAGLGYQLLYVLQATNFNSTSVSFNRKFFNLGAKYGIEMDSRTVPFVLVGGGLQYNMPGKLVRIENGDHLGKISYNHAIGIYVESGVSVKVGRKTSLEPMLRFRSTSFNADSYTDGTLTELDEELLNLRSSGLELALTFVKKL